MQEIELKFSRQTDNILIKWNFKKEGIKKKKANVVKKEKVVKVFQPRQTLNCFRSRDDDRDRSAKVPTSLKLHNLRGDCSLRYWLLPHSHDHCRKLSSNMGCYQGQITEKYAKLVHRQVFGES